MKKTLLTLFVLAGCVDKPQPLQDGEMPDNMVILSKSELTENTSVYKVEIEGRRYIIVNGINKISVCHH
jgi:starvation-inducible outer membrane lipoprotein